MVKIGAIFPQTEIGADPVAIRDYAQAVEDLGFSHLLAFDHVLGANTERPDRAARRWAYTFRHMFHEPLVLFGYLAAVTRRIELATGVLILPQRQTALVAKQAAEVDVLCGGRLRFGVGLGWNEVEYEALGERFHNRGRRVEEQIALLRLLWTQELVTFHGRWHRVTDAGIRPLPVQRPIPIWMGGWDDRALRRMAALADGWIVLSAWRTPDEARAKVAAWREYARQAGRDPSTLGLDAFLSLARSPQPDDWRRELAMWRELGATHVSINTMRAGLATPGAHVEALRRVKAALEAA